MSTHTHTHAHNVTRVATRPENRGGSAVLAVSSTCEDFELGVELLQEEDDDFQLVESLRVDSTAAPLQPLLLQPVAEEAPGLQQELCVLDAYLQRHQAAPDHHGHHVVHTLQHLLPWPHDVNLQEAEQSQTGPPAHRQFRKLVCVEQKLQLGLLEQKKCQSKSIIPVALFFFILQTEKSGTPARSRPAARWCPWRCSWP